MARWRHPSSILISPDIDLAPAAAEQTDEASELPVEPAVTTFSTSESSVSDQNSIYKASLAEQHDYANHTPADLQDERWPPSDAAHSWENIVAGPDGNPVPSSFLQPPPINTSRHEPHVLYPITEKNSLATIRTRLSVKSSHLNLRPRSSRSCSSGMLSGTTMTSHPVLRRKFFSLTDLPATIKQLHKSPSSSSDIVQLPTPITPHYRPPERTPTPPGLPSFGKPEAMEYRLPRPPSGTRFRERFLRAPSPEELQWRRQTRGLPRGVVMRGEDGVLIRGRFIPSRSGHLPPSSDPGVHRSAPDAEPRGGPLMEHRNDNRNSAQAHQKRSRHKEHDTRHKHLSKFMACCCGSGDVDSDNDVDEGRTHPQPVAACPGVVRVPRQVPLY